MQFFQADRPWSLATLIKVLTILGVLLIVLAVLALLNDVLVLLDRFRTAVYLFVFGALLAYLIAPAVHLLQRVLHKNWAAVLASYLLLFVGVLGLGTLLLSPFVSQAQSLVKNMQNPSAASLIRLHNVQTDLAGVRTELSTQQRLLAAGHPIAIAQVQQAQADIARLVQQASTLSTAKIQKDEAPIPSSYAGPIVTQVRQLQSAYGQVGSTIDAGRLTHTLAVADEAATQANNAYQKAASTPRLLLSLQAELDNHGIAVDLNQRFNQAAQSVKDQLTSLLNNALNVGLQAGNLLLDVVLIFLISIYFVRDGGRLVQWLVHLVPTKSRPPVSSAVTNLDQILGSYLRTQIVLALLAGISDATGAIILGVPYAVVIFLSSFLLSLVPVIGPVVLPIPPLLIALLFTPLPTPIIYLAWLLVGEQIITNVVGPRLQAHNLRIHPLEAMGAALIGLPIAGIAGAFFAVPIVAFFHIVIREFAYAHHMATPTAAGPSASDQTSTNERAGAAASSQES